MKLKAELEIAMPRADDRVPLTKLESLPYLTAVIQEALRLSYGVSSRLQRISPDKPLVYTDAVSRRSWKIPSGTPVGMTSVLIHHDESVFPDSYEFHPERWIGNPGLNRYMVSFSKGSRQCLGMNLAYAEMYLVLARLFRRYSSAVIPVESKKGMHRNEDQDALGLVNIDKRNVEVAADGFIPLRASRSMGIQIYVRQI